IPYDTESPFKCSGIRVGTASITTRGMKEAEAAMIGTWIADVLEDISDVSVQQAVKAKAAALTAKFLVP
ncbi:MAG: serine hydroxymethyltransferase, partial [Oscillospiraceae bacterium]|nr:serine hydroxymethyltransferase [Oscillospiraceae bacterium]